MPSAYVNTRLYTTCTNTYIHICTQTNTLAYAQTHLHRTNKQPYIPTYVEPHIDNTMEIGD